MKRYSHMGYGGNRFVAAAAALVLAVCVALPAFAVNASLTNIVPRGAQRGGDRDIEFVGSGLADAVDIVFHEPGIGVAELKAEKDNSVKVKLKIAPDCRLGTHALRVRTKTGMSNLQVFSVGNLNEIPEPEPNEDPAKAPEVPLGTTINGVTTAEDVDYYAVKLAKDQRLAVEIEGLRLGRVLYDPKLRFFDSAGHELIAEDDTQVLKQDAGFVVSAKEEGRYVVAVSDATYGGSGDCFYRLHVGAFPRPLMVTPLGGKPGTKVDLAWLGDPGLAKQSVDIPNLPMGTQGIEPASDAGLAPTEVPFRFSDLAGVLEAEPNDAADKPTAGAAPGAFDGVIDKPGDIDYFAFEGKKDQVYDFRVWARALGSPLDSVFVVVKPDGNALASDDDAAAVDAYVRATLPADGQYKMYVYDHLKRGGPAFSYRVEVTPVVPKLKLSLLENRPVYATLPAGNQTYLLVNVSRADFDGPVKINMPDLPQGVTAHADVVPAGATTVPVILTAAADAPLGGGLVTLDSMWDDPNQKVSGGLEQEVRLVDGINDTTFFGRPVDKLALAVGAAAPFSISVVAPKAPGVQAGFVNLTVEAKRAEGFKDAIELYFPWLPPGLGGGTARIEAEKTSTQIRLEIRGDAPVTKDPIIVGARSAGYQLCSQPISYDVQQPFVAFEIAPAETELGKPVNINVKLKHRVPFEGKCEFSVFGLPKGVTTKPQSFDKDTQELVFPLELDKDAKDGKFEGIGLQGAITTAGEPVQHVGYGGKLVLYAPLPKDLAPAAPPPPPPPGQPARKTRFPTT